MAGVFRKAMVWLGLAPDEEYDDYGYGEAPRPGPARPGAGPGGVGPMGPGTTGGPMGQQRPQARPYPRGAGDPDEGVVVQRGGGGGGGRPSASVRPLPGRGGLADDPRAARRDETPTVRPMRPTSAKPTVVVPEDFDAAKDVADRFKADQPVVMDLQATDRELSRRLIDFASGICYGLGGHMERVNPGMYLLTPSNVEVSDEERRRLRSPGR